MKAYDYQERSIEHLCRVLPQAGAAVDASDPGTGKTLVAVEVMRRLNKPTLIVCPKAVIPGWNRTAAAQGTELDCLNYERIRMGSTEFGQWKAPDIYHESEWFRWHPGIGLLVFDEGHRCKGYQTKNSQLMKAARRQNIPTLVLSATLADTPMEMDALGYLLRMHDSDRGPTVRNPTPFSFCDWAAQYSCGGRPFRFQGGVEDMTKINRLLFPDKGVRVRIPELGDAFPETQITCELYDLDDPGKMASIREKMAAALATLKTRTDNYFNDEYCMGLRQEAELLKVPIFVSMAEDAIAQNMSVAFFVNFRLTLDEILRRLGSDCRIDGTQVGARGAKQREANRLRFQNDESRVIGCISEAGGVGLDLHDVTGKHPRLSLISPGWDAKLLRQLVGRVWRSGGRSKSLQRFVFTTGEEGVQQTVFRKLGNLDALNDGDLLPR